MTNVKIAITQKREPLPPSPTRPPLWRVKHDAELGPLWRPNLPEVHPYFPNHHSPFSREWQLFSFELNQPWLTPEKWTVVYNDKLWITNHNGFGNPDDLRANHVLGIDLNQELPKVEALTCGGNIMTGRVSGSNLIVETLDWRAKPPSVEWLNAHPWFRTTAVSVDSAGNPRRFPQGRQPNGYMADIYHPLIADPSRFVVTFPLWKLQFWTAVELPDPYTFYTL